MSIDLTGLVRPHVVEMTKREDNPNVAEFRLQPLERGFGHTIGNSLRRLLLSSLRGSAVWGFRLDGVVHEHQTVQGVLEDVHQIVQRLDDEAIAGLGGDSRRSPWSSIRPSTSRSCASSRRAPARSTPATFSRPATRRFTTRTSCSSRCRRIARSPASST